MLESGVGGQDGVVGLNNSGGDLRSGIDGKLQLGLLPVVHGKSLHEKGRKSRSSSSSKGVEEQKSLKTSTLVSKLPDPVQDEVHNLLADGVVAPGVVVGGVLLSVDQLLRMVKLTVSSNSGLVNDSWLQVNEDSSWNMLSASGLGEEGLEGVVPKCLVRGHAAIGLDSMLEAVELPTSIANLATGLADMNRDTLTLKGNVCILTVKCLVSNCGSYHCKISAPRESQGDSCSAT